MQFRGRAVAPHAPTTNTNLNKEGRATNLDRQAAEPRKPKHNNHSHLGGEKGKKSEENQEKDMGEKKTQMGTKRKREKPKFKKKRQARQTHADNEKKKKKREKAKELGEEEKKEGKLPAPQAARPDDLSSRAATARVQGSAPVGCFGLSCPSTGEQLEPEKPFILDRGAGATIELNSFCECP